MFNDPHIYPSRKGDKRDWMQTMLDGDGHLLKPVKTSREPKQWVKNFYPSHGRI